MVTIEMTSEDYSEFLRCLTNLKEICNDVDIRNGIIRQRSNDITSVFELDMTSIIQDATIPISDLKKKIDLFKTFAGQEVMIEIDSDQPQGEEYYKISDQFSSIKFGFPALEYMDNKYMTQEELDSIFTLDDEDLILDDTIPVLITDRIKVITENFNTAAIQVQFEGDIASICTSTQSKDQFAKIKADIATNVDMGNCFSNLSTIPFSIEHDENVEFKMHKAEDQNVSENRIKTTLGSVDINIYSRSALVYEEE